MNEFILSQINDRPRQTIENLINALGKSPSQFFSGQERTIPIGIEIEVPWRAFFPDLWMEGFPNVPEADLKRISAECTRREQTLLPKLMKAQASGIPSGADKYWEFAFEPVTDVSILCNQVETLRVNDLMPEGKHALHITVGGVEPSPALYFVAMILEAYACDSDRLRTGFGGMGVYNLPKGWAKKGRAGLFLKEGSHDLLHGYEVGTEFRTLFTPAASKDMYFLLDTAQWLVEVSTDPNHGFSHAWYALVLNLRNILKAHGLPDKNWGRPNQNEQLWCNIAEVFPSVQKAVRETFERSVLHCPPPN